MKKIVSVLLCLALLFSFGAFASAEEAPQLNLTASKASADAFSAAPGQYVNFICSFWNCSSFESFEILITYNPEVLQYSAVYPLPKTEVVKHAIDCTVIQPGKLQVIGNNTCGYGGSNEFDPFCLKVIGEGDTDISVELVSFKTTDGEVENVKFDADIQNFTVEEAPQLKVSTRKVPGDDWEEHYCFSLGVKNCMEFESLELLITYNPEVLEYSKVFPYAMPDEYRHLISCTVEDAGKLRVTAYCWDLHMCGHIEKIEPFCFNFIGTGDTDVAVELVSFKTAGGEVENVKFDTSIQNFTVTELYIKYDLTGDGFVSSEDARLALRFAVGLDTPTDEQRCAVGLGGGGEFTSALARDILRAAVGLPA